MGNDKKYKIRRWLIRFLSPKMSNSVITEEIRAQALAARRMEHAVKQKEKEVALLERIMKIENMANPNSSPMDKMIEQCIPILLAKIQGDNPNSGTALNISTPPQLAPTTTNSDGVVYDDKQIKDLFIQNPKIKMFAPQCNDEQIREYLIQQIPNLAKESIDKILIEVRK